MQKLGPRSAVDRTPGLAGLDSGRSQQHQRPPVPPQGTDCRSSQLLATHGIRSSWPETEHKPHRLVLRHDAGLVVSFMANGVSETLPVQVEGFTRYAPA